jgi:hypothetical protein
MVKASYRNKEGTAKVGRNAGAKLRIVIFNVRTLFIVVPAEG